MQRGKRTRWVGDFQTPFVSFFFIIRILTRCFVFSFFSRFRRWSVLFIWRGSMFRCFLRMRCSDVAFLYLGYLQQRRDISFAIIFPATTKKSFCLCHTPEMDIQIRATPPSCGKTVCWFTVKATRGLSLRFTVKTTRGLNAGGGEEQRGSF